MRATDPGAGEFFRVPREILPINVCTVLPLTSEIPGDFCGTPDGILLAQSRGVEAIMEITPRLTNFFAHYRVLYEVRHAPRDIPPLDLPRRLGLAPRTLVKTIPFHYGGEIAFFVHPVECEPDPKRFGLILADQPNAPFTRDEIAHYFPDCEAGAIPPLAEPYGAFVYMDRCVPLHRKITFHGGSLSQLIRLPYPIFDLLVQPLHVGLCAGCQGCGMAKVASAPRR